MKKEKGRKRRGEPTQKKLERERNLLERINTVLCSKRKKETEAERIGRKF